MKVTKIKAGSYNIVTASLSFIASYRAIYNDWIIKLVNNKLGDHLHCDTLGECKQAIVKGYWEDSVKGAVYRREVDLGDDRCSA